MVVKSISNEMLLIFKMRNTNCNILNCEVIVYIIRDVTLQGLYGL